MLSRPGPTASSRPPSSAVLSKTVVPGTAERLGACQERGGRAGCARGGPRRPDVSDPWHHRMTRVSRAVWTLSTASRAFSRAIKLRRRTGQVVEPHDENRREAQKPRRQDAHRNRGLDQREAGLFVSHDHSLHPFRPFQRHGRISAVVPIIVTARRAVRLVAADRQKHRAVRSGRLTRSTNVPSHVNSRGPTVSKSVALALPNPSGVSGTSGLAAGTARGSRARPSGAPWSRSYYRSSRCRSGSCGRRRGR